MKIIKGLAIFCVVGMLFGSCFSPPELSVTPSISYNSIYFTTSPLDTVKDSLVLIINFKDGNGDLGLNTDDPQYREYPYNPVNYFLADGNGGLQSIGSESLQLSSSNGGAVIQVLNPVLVVPSNVTGKLVTNRTRKSPNYADKLPGFPSTYPCPTYAYSYDSVAVVGADSVIFDNTYHVKRVIHVRDGNNRPNKIFILRDTLYYEPNPKHTNITVKFMVKNNDGSYTEFDWRKNYCGTFDQRFPVLSEKNGALEGTLKYGMTSKGFLSIFSVKTLKLSIQIQDREFHSSNTIETPDFTLNGIKR